MAVPSRRLNDLDASIAKALILTPWAQHDIAALFGCNPGRIAEIATGQAFEATPAADLSTERARARLAELQNAWVLRIARQLSQVLRPHGALL
ncbi:hypothetical protein [Kaistia sp. MMO-174]|uniref:hypothetical protein n=1 Tax=Kaistia sp. MMO-174 TaxID=3081256 RepID=UPI0030191B24